MDPWIFWFGFGLILILLEFAVPGIILVFFGLAAWLVATLAAVGILPTVGGQVLVFGLASLGFTLGLRRLFRRFLHGPEPALLPGTPMDEFAGKTAIALTEFSGPGAMGKVEFKGAEWRARSEEELDPGDQVEIVSLDGLTLNIRRQWLNALPSVD